MKLSKIDTVPDVDDAVAPPFARQDNPEIPLQGQVSAQITVQRPPVCLEEEPARVFWLRWYSTQPQSKLREIPHIRQVSQASLLGVLA